MVVMATISLHDFVNLPHGLIKLASEPRIKKQSFPGGTTQEEL